MKINDIMANYTPGEPANTWVEEFASILPHGEGLYIADLMRDIHKDGMKVNILLGNDGRVWNGHHRLEAARLLGWEEVPVTHVENGYTDKEAGLE